MYWFYSSKILADYFSVKIILRFLSLQLSDAPLNYVIEGGLKKFNTLMGVT